MLKGYLLLGVLSALLFGAESQNPYIEASKKKKDPHVTSTHGKPVPRYQLLPPVTAKKPKPKPKPKPKIIIDENGKEVVVQEEEIKLSPQELELKEAKIKCIDDDGAWCWKVGIYYLEGKIVKQDYDEALKAFEAGCVKKSGGACYNAGYLYEFGRGDIPYDHAKALDYFLKSCNYGYDRGCGAWRDMK